VCSGQNADCRCEPHSPCIIQCESKDACQNARLACPIASECIIHCGDNGCAKATILGPRDADFSIYCDSTAACTDMQVHTYDAANVLFSCAGKDACKGSGAQINCGNEMCTLLFLGESSGDSAQINVNGAKSLECVGRYAACPANFDVPCPIETDVLMAGCEQPRRWNTKDCVCECPSELVIACGTHEIWNENLCECEINCPSWAPTEAQCDSIGMEWRDCQCVQSNYCCLSMRKQWNGMCWAETTPEDCAAVLGQRCVWDTTQCMNGPPVNALDPYQPCGFNGDHCTSNVDCCSEICKVDGLCY